MGKPIGTDLLSCIFLLFPIYSKILQADCSAFHLVHAGFLLVLFFDSEGGGYVFHLNFSRLSVGYIALYRIRSNVLLGDQMLLVSCLRIAEMLNDISYSLFMVQIKVNF
jgi:hypothetical protein